MSEIFSVMLVIAGHFFGAYMFYFFHRYIFHGPLGKYPILKQWKAIHTRHHQRPQDPGAFFFPWWANLAVWVYAFSLFLISPPFSIGVISFFAFYAYRHKLAHTGFRSTAADHHMSHHNGKVKSNFSGTYPFIDKIFGTYQKT